MKSIKKFVCFIMLCLFALTMIGCNDECPVVDSCDDECPDIVPVQDDIIILYTNDVHCAIDENIGYAGLASYKNKMLEQTKNVTLIDCGDAIQGDTIGTVSSGEFIVDIMNEVGYDLAVLGNHEFDFGLSQLNKLIANSKAKYIGANIKYTGSGENMLSDVAPYEIITYGDVKVAYIGVSTPKTITSSTPKYFMDASGNFVYDFYNDTTGAAFYNCIQSNIDECKAKGADYIICCAHLGDDEGFAPYSSVDLVKNTSGIDVVLDAHAHQVIPTFIEKDAKDNDVLISSTGTKLQNFGKLVISGNGSITTSLITRYEDKDEKVSAYIDSIKAEYEEEMNTVVASSDISLSCNDESGKRLVRRSEATIGNFCADAYRAMANADIAFVNGGGIRADLPSGDITYADLIAIHPYGNTLCLVEATGQEIIDALEMAYSILPEESGGFLHISGLKIKVDTTIESTVVKDDLGMFEKVAGERRVTEVLVENSDGSYSPIDLTKTYTVASHNYLIKNGGSGNNVFVDNNLLIDEGMLDYEILINYIRDVLKGKLGDSYSETEGRITIK